MRRERERGKRKVEKLGWSRGKEINIRRRRGREERKRQRGRITGVRRRGIGEGMKEIRIGRRELHILF